MNVELMSLRAACHAVNAASWAPAAPGAPAVTRQESAG